MKYYYYFLYFFENYICRSMFTQGQFQQPMQQQTYQQTLQNNQKQASFNQFTNCIDVTNKVTLQPSLQNLLILLRYLQ